MNGKKEILFVDDESNVLDGLRRMLRPMRNEWNMHFVTSGEQALQHLATNAAHVVVSDMRMPAMNGAELLTRVQELHPESVRIVLSGYADQEMIMKTINCAHQFLAKPCNPEVLRATIERTSRANVGSRDERIRALVSRFSEIPSFPANYDELVGRIRDPEASIEQVAEVVSRDPSMSAHLLKLVNSAFFGLPRRISDIVDAVNVIGLDTLRSLVLSAHIFRQFRTGHTGCFSFDELRAHALRTATGARALAEAEGFSHALAGETFAAGMLHDIGRLVMAQNFPDEYDSVMTTIEAEGCPACTAESMILEMNHCEVGAALLTIWGLPDALIDTTAWHHDPSGSGQTELTPLSFVHVAAAWSEHPGKSVDEFKGLDQAYLETIDVIDRLSAWRTTFLEAGAR